MNVDEALWVADRSYVTYEHRIREACGVLGSEVERLRAKVTKLQEAAEAVRGNENEQCN